VAYGTGCRQRVQRNQKVINKLLVKRTRFYLKRADNSIVTLYELTLFCFLTGNADMHLKNFSLWRSDAQTIALTPAYGLLATKLLLPTDMEEMNLSLNGKKSHLREADWLAFVQYLGLTDRQRTNVHQRFRKRLVSALSWIDISFLTADSQVAYRNLLAGRARQLGLMD
jgi:serine/threonine-protein kinase HipA